jgi:hypothetical protein
VFRIPRYLCALVISITAFGGGALLTGVISASPAGATQKLCAYTSTGDFHACLTFNTGASPETVRAYAGGNGNLCLLGTAHVELYNTDTGATYNSGTVGKSWCGSSTIYTGYHDASGDYWTATLWQYYNGGYHVVAREYE